MCDIVFEKAKGRGRIVNRASVSCRNSRPKGSLKYVFPCEFCEICKSTFFAEQHRTTASDFSSISSSEGSTGNETVNYETRTKAYVLI